MGRFEVFSVWFDRNMLSRVKSPNLTVQSSFESKKVAKFKFAQASAVPGRQVARERMAKPPINSNQTVHGYLKG